MNFIRRSYIVLILLSIPVVVGVYYWSVRHLIESDNPLRHELLVGEAFVILYSSPVWLGLVTLSLLNYRCFSLKKIVMSFVPTLLIFAPTLLREVSNAL